MRRVLVAIAVAMVSLAGSALGWAQTNDHVFRSWRWEEEVAAARPAGLAGAFVAVANDASAAALNPAGLLALPRDGREIAASALRRGSGTAGPGDSFLSRTGLGYGGAAIRLGDSWAIGASYAEPRALRLEISPFLLPSGARDHGFIEAELHNFGVSAAFLATPRLRLGAGLTASRLTLDANGGRSVDRVFHEVVNEASEETRLRPSVGLLYDAGSKVRLGLLARPGAGWTLNRNSFNPAASIVLDPGSRHRVRAPDVFSAGATVRVFRRLLLTGQADLVRYSQIRNDMGVMRGAVLGEDYVLDDALEARAGAEWTIPVGSLDLALRGGLYSQAPGSIVYVGPDRDEATAFSGSERRLIGAAGATVMTRQGVGLDAATVWGGDRRLFLLGARYRF
jgi:hypothetical protein